MHALRGLYAITPDDCLLPRLSALVAAALDGGVRLVQYRNKLAPPPLRRAQAADLLRLCRARGALLIINDDLPLALQIGADGVHLGRGDGDIAAARAALGPGRILGISCYADMANAEATAAAGLAKATAECTAAEPLALLSQAHSRFALPVAAIGGITLENAAPTIAAGADMLAVVTDLFDTMDISGRARAYARLFA